MNDIQILKELLKPEALVSLEVGIYGKKKATLEEPDQYTVDIGMMPSDSEVVIVKIDTFPPPQKLFNGAKKECKRADYAIIYCDTAKKPEKIIFLIELKAKSTTSSEDEIIAQLKGGSCVISYIQSIGEKFWNKSDFLKNYEYRYVSIKNISINKKTTRLKNNASVKHDKPENMLKISSPKNLYFRQLI